MSRLVLYMFYKNIVFALAQFWYTMFTGWSGQKLYVELGIQSYNVVYTGLPVLLMAVLDRDVSAKSAIRFPFLYHDGLVSAQLNTKVFWTWIACAFFESVLLLAVPAIAMNHSSHLATSPYVFELGTAVFAGVVFVVNLRIVFETYLLHWAYLLITFLSAVSWIPFALIFAEFDADGMKGGMGYVALSHCTSALK